MLKKIIEGIDVSLSLKLHVLFCHLEKSLDYLKGYGLGVWSEQAGESIHREFFKFWNYYKINCMENVSYSTNLLRAVIAFSSRHL